MKSTPNSTNRETHATALLLHVALMGILLATVGVVIGGSQTGYATGNQSCTSGNNCVSWVAAGGTYRGYSTVNVNDMKQSTFENGVVIGNNVGYGRNRNSAYGAICYFSSAYGTGLYTGQARYVGHTWELLDQTTESSRGTTNPHCIY